MIVQKLEQQDIGLMLVNISMQDAEPPTAEVIEAFKAVETAKQAKRLRLTMPISIRTSRFHRQKPRLTRSFRMPKQPSKSNQ